MTHDPSLRTNPIDPDDPRNISDPYVRRPARTTGSGIALVLFGIVAVLLIGFAMLGNYSNTTGVNTAPPSTTNSTTEPAVPPAQPEQPAAPAPSTNGQSNP